MSYPKPYIPEGYKHFFEQEPLPDSSSKWVDTEIYREWTGLGKTVELNEFNEEMEGQE